ncbi:hypothetical protein SAMN05216467_0866 [Cellulomonas sp. KH9]|nr:hypothetical protein SAMN05216467_0866 [Cellulomonas sp. KH9]
MRHTLHHRDRAGGVATAAGGPTNRRMGCGRARSDRVRWRRSGAVDPGAVTTWRSPGAARRSVRR